MSIKDFFVKEKPVFTGITRGVGGFGFGGSSGSAAPTISASGGAKIETGGYVYHLFYNGLSGSDNFVVSEGSTTITYVCVAGGGGGGCGKTLYAPNHYSGGGGGAGGYRTGTATVTAGTTYPVSVGAGGGGVPGSPPHPAYGARGGTTTFGLSTQVVATGGGGGESRTARSNGSAPNTAQANMPGGSGGGNAEDTNYNRGITTDSPDGISPAVQGNNGGYGDNGGQTAGGGGGAGGAGGNGLSPNTPGQGNGGAGGNGSATVFPGPGLYPQLPSPYSNGLGTAWRDALGAPGAVAGGGGGAYGFSNNNNNAGGDGGSGGGGDAFPGQDGLGSDGVDGTGGGAGGGATNSNSNPADGGDGGNGCIMVRYPA